LEEEPTNDDPTDGDDGTIDDGDDDGGGGGGGGDSGDGSDDGSDTSDDGSTGTSSDDPIPMTVVLTQDVVVISSTPITTTTIDLYSLYALLDDNPDYLYDYTTNPTTPLKGEIITVLPAGGTIGTDPNFQKGKTPASGTAIYAPAGTVLGGWQVTVSYTITNVNGVATVTVTTIGAATIGSESMITTYQITSSSFSVNGSVITFNFDGSNVFGVYGQGYHISTNIQGTYNTSTGVYSIYVTRN